MGKILRIKTIVLLTGLGLLAGVAESKGDVHYVKAGGTGDGSSWEQASGDLQAIIDVSENGDEVWIAAGIYRPSKLIANNVANSKSFILKDGVSLYGGFSGFETSLDERSMMEYGENWDFSNETILDGDDDTEDVWERGIAPGTTYRYTWHLENNQIPGTAGNCCHLLYNPDIITNHTVIDGITFTRGAANQHKAKTYGGGVYAKGNVSVSRCIFRYNLTYFRNEPLSNDINAYGGGLYLVGTGEASVNDCYFYRNYANSSYTLGRGGGLYAQNAQVSGCLFEECVAEDGGGGAYIVGGNITDCRFVDCYGSAGGGLLVDSEAEKITAVKCRGLNGGGIYVDTDGRLSCGMIYDCYADAEEFGDELGGSGGGLFLMEATAVGCVVYNNFAFNGGGVCVRGESKVVNSTIQHNDARKHNPDAANAAVWAGEGDCTDYYFNCITDATLADSNFVKPTDFVGLAENEEQFQDMVFADWHLTTDSPLVDTGTATPGFDEPTDFAGNPRIQGNGIDPGAYETEDYSKAEMTPSDVIVTERWITFHGEVMNFPPTENGIYIHQIFFRDGKIKNSKYILIK